MENLSDELKLRTLSPGKVLVCGGYLVINPDYRGLVLCTKTYFICDGIIKEIPMNNNSKMNFDNKESICEIFIRVNSINYGNSYLYKLQILKSLSNSSTGIQLKLNKLDLQEFYQGEKEKDDKYSNYKIINNNENAFIYNSIKCSFYMAILNIINKSSFENFLKITQNKVFLNSFDIDGDYRFYSYDKEYMNSNISNNIKTGLGSSSALMTSLSSNIILNFHRLFQNIELSKDFNQLTEELKTCILVGSYNGNNFAQNKVS